MPPTGAKLRWLLASISSAIYAIEHMGDRSPIPLAELKELKAILEEMLSE